MEDHILYEQPLNETVRVCLRLECLFAQTEYRLDNKGYWNNRAAVASIVDLYNVLDRPEFKAKLTKQLIQTKEIFSAHLDDAEVDQNKLEHVIQQIQSSIEHLQSISGKLNQSLEQNEFLNSVRLRLSKTGGARNFDLPMYHYWLHQDESKRLYDMQQWYQNFDEIRHIIHLFLKLTRSSGNFCMVNAVNGYYETTLDTTVDYQLLRIYVPKELNAFPDISVGRHRMSLHFFTLSADDKRATQYKNDVEFQLACCV